MNIKKVHHKYWYFYRLLKFLTKATFNGALEDTSPAKRVGFSSRPEQVLTKVENGDLMSRQKANIDPSAVAITINATLAVLSTAS